MGKTSAAIGLVRERLAAVLAEEGWKLQGADNAVSAWNALATPGKLGTIVALWTGETVVEQEEESLVTDLAFSVWIAARRHEQDNGTRRQAQEVGDLAASEAHDRIKAALLALDVSEVGRGRRTPGRSTRGAGSSRRRTACPSTASNSGGPCGSRRGGRKRRRDEPDVRVQRERCGEHLLSRAFLLEYPGDALAESGKDPEHHSDGRAGR